MTTCHDSDAFRTLLVPASRESHLPSPLVRRTLEGLRRSAVVVCDSEASRAEIVEQRIVRPDRTLVVPLGVDPMFDTTPDAESDRAAEALTGPPGTCDLLHVGSTIPRKGIDTLLQVLARVSTVRRDAMLWRVGGAFTRSQAALVEQLELGHRIRVLPFVTPNVLAALYRRASLVLLPSHREGFGLPVAEALGCGTPVIASDIPVLRELGGSTVEYCAPGDSAAWSARILKLLQERDINPHAWAERCAAGRTRAARYTWPAYAMAMERVYQDVCDHAREARV